MARVFVRRSSGNFVEARYADVTPPSITLHEALTELCTNLGDGMDQAADISLFATSIPSWNFTPRTILGN